MSKNPNREPTNAPKKEDPTKEEGGRLVYTEGDGGTHKLTQVVDSSGQVVDPDDDDGLREAVKEMTKLFKTIKSQEEEPRTEDNKKGGEK